MSKVGGRYQSAGRCERWQGILVMLAVVGALCAGAGAQINVTETGLHDGDLVYGFSAPPAPNPYENSQSITLFAQGETNPSLYPNLWFGAYGFYSGWSLVNTGVVDVNAAGGYTISSGDAAAPAPGHGIYAAGDVQNAGAVRVTATGGTAEAVGWAQVHGSARGIESSADVDNSGTLTVTARGGTADAGPGANVIATAQGIGSSGGDVRNSGALNVAAFGGAASASEAYADADATGIRATGEVDNTGALAIDAIGGTARTAALGVAYGIFGNDNVTNGGALAVTGTGGLADAHDLERLANADGEAYGVLAIGGLITNRRPVDVTAAGGTALSGVTLTYEGNTSASGRAYGLFAGDGAIENSSTVTATANGGSATGTATDAYLEVFALAQAYGLYLPNSGTFNYPDRHIGNSGDLVVTATGGSAQGSVEEANASASAYGIQGYGAPIVNSGQVTVTAAGGDALGSSSAEYDTGAHASALAYGIRSEEANVDNSGAIVVSGIGGTATGAGDAQATARTEVRGIYVTGHPYSYGDPMQDATNTVHNHAPITATATGGTAESAASEATVDVQAHGLITYYADVVNTGDISVTAGGGNGSSAGAVAVFASATGMYTSSGEADNSGNITAAADAGTSAAGGGATAWGQAFALGIGADGALRNSGEITVTAHGGSATGGSGTSANAFAIGIQGTALALNNRGAITATATAEPGSTSYAYGIETVGYTSLTNTGVIRVTADTAYEVHVTFNTTTLVGTYNVTLDGDPNRAAFGVAEGATLALNNARLTATAVSGETLWDTEYKLFETEGTGAVDGNFAEVRAVNPSTIATYHDQGTAASVDDTVSLAYMPVGSMSLSSAAVQKQLITQAGDVVNHHMTTILLQNILSPSPSGLLADAGSTAESLALAEAAADKTSGVFVEPYYSLLDHDANPLGYEARLWGFSGGYEHYFGNTLLGLHLGYGQADIDYTGTGFRGNSEEQDVVTGGFNALTRWEPWILHYGVTGFYGDHDYEGLTGFALADQETASYHSYGTAATLMAGHIFRWGPHVLLPEAGFNWLWVHRPQYTTEATDPNWDTTYSGLDDHDIYAAAALQWLSTFLHDGIHITPSVGVGVRYLLTDDETNAQLSIPGAAPVVVKSEQDRTALTLSGSLTLTKTPHALSLSYDGDYSPDVQRHSVWLRYTWLF